MSISGVTFAASPPAAATRPETASGKASAKAPGAAAKTSTQDEAALRQLKARDAEVRQHEMAHLAAAGGLATSGASFTYQKGADGVNYAVGGEVSIDTSPGRTPEETMARARTIRAAAMAPAEPSAQDRAVAAQAAQMALQAAMELAQQQGGEKSATTLAAKDRSAQMGVYFAQPASGGALDVRA